MITQEKVQEMANDVEFMANESDWKVLENHKALIEIAINNWTLINDYGKEILTTLYDGYLAFTARNKPQAKYGFTLDELNKIAAIHSFVNELDAGKIAVLNFACEFPEIDILIQYLSAFGFNELLEIKAEYNEYLQEN